MERYAKRTLIVLAVLMPCAGRAAEPIREYAKAVAQTPGLVAWWRFEGDLKDAKGAAHGVLMPAMPARAGTEAAFGAGPAGGKALVLAHKRFASMGPTGALDLARGTIELWFRADFDPAVRYNPCLLAKRAHGDHTRTRFSFHVWRDYSCLALWNGRDVVRFRPAAGRVERGRWHHAAFTCDGREVRAYLDGVPCVPASTPVTFNTARKRLPLQIGSSTPKGQEWLDGAIDEVAVYARALRAEEIATHVDAMGFKARRQAVVKKLAALRAERTERRRKRLAELFDAKTLYAAGRTKTYRGEQLTAVSLPVGGIGAGVIQMDGRARPAVWQIFGNYPYVHVPHSFVAARVIVEGGKPVVRALQTEGVGPFAPMKRLSFRGEYPLGWYEFDDPAVPVKITLEAFSPMIPVDAKGSAIPCAIFNLTAENTGEKPAAVSFLACQQNAVGYAGRTEISGRSCKDYGGNVSKVLREKGATLVRMTARKGAAAAGVGDMALACLSAEATADPAWATLDKLRGDLLDDGKLSGEAEAGPSGEGSTLDAGVAAAAMVGPGRKRTVTFVLAWHFPGGRHGRGGWGGAGNMYQNWWPNALAVARHVRDELGELTAKTRLYHKTLYESNLPHWLIDRIGSQAAVLRSMTCFWTQAGYFGGWEGCCPNSGCCHGNCNHVWHYAQAHARLFPSIARRMREQEFGCQSADGSIPFRQPKHPPATDGQCGAVLNAYREHLMSRDGAWLKRNWPSIRKAMDYIIATWDADGDGVLAGRQWNTLDCAIDGSSSWLGSLYLAALAAAEKMAALQGQAALAKRYRTLRLSGMAKQNETLFNGEYYVQLPGEKRYRDYLSGCHIDQVLGQWWAHQLDLGWLYPRERVRTAMESLLKYNFQPDFHGIRQAPRKFVADDDAGMQMITWPKGGRPPAQHCMRYGDEVMTGFEYAAAATMVQAGMLKEGLGVCRAIYERYDGRRRTNLTASRTASWGYSGNPFGDDECGKFYARAMSVWSVLLACQGFVYDGPAGVLGFRPQWKGDDHRSFFAGAEGWGLFSQQRREGRQIERIELRFGRLRLKTLVFALPDGARAKKVTGRCGGKAVAAKLSMKDGDVRIALGGTLSMQAGQTLEIVINY